jgi:hypothetical protein
MRKPKKASCRFRAITSRHLILRLPTLSFACCIQNKIIGSGNSTFSRSYCGGKLRYKVSIHPREVELAANQVIRRPLEDVPSGDLKDKLGERFQQRNSSGSDAVRLFGNSGSVVGKQNWKRALSFLP